MPFILPLPLPHIQTHIPNNPPSVTYKRSTKQNLIYLVTAQHDKQFLGHFYGKLFFGGGTPDTLCLSASCTRLHRLSRKQYQFLLGQPPTYLYHGNTSTRPLMFSEPCTDNLGPLLSGMTVSLWLSFAYFRILQMFFLVSSEGAFLAKRGENCFSQSQ